MMKKLTWFMVLLAALIFGLSACGGGGGGNGGGGDDDDFARLFTLPDTGQVTCYNTAGTIIDCDGTGQDGEFSVNPLSYTDNGNATVTDNVTGLIWQKSDDGTTRTWQQALDYCNDLTLAGNSNWRLPTRRELHIVDYGRFDPSVDPVFNSMPFLYWSASSNLGLPGLDLAWGVDFHTGGAYSVFKTDNRFVRCVLGNQQPESTFTDNGNNTVTDETTGLIWQKTDNDTTPTWQQALDYCNGLTLGDSKNWRLPNIKELESIVDVTLHNPASDQVFSTKASRYWSASSCASSPDSAWVVDFVYGFVYHGSYSYKTDGYYVRCVR